MFLVIFANPAGETGVPVEVNVPTEVFGQIFGVTKHAGIVISVVSVRK